MKPIRVLIADDHEVVRQGLRTIIEGHSGWVAVGEAGSGREAVELARQLKPDVAVLDITMPELNGLDAAKQILRDLPDTEILILTMHHSEQIVREILETGARGYLLKSDAARDLVSAIQALSQHRPFLTGGASEILLRDYLKPVDRQDRGTVTSTRLTPREREIVQLLAEGKSNKEVATSLGISVKTAETHRNNIMQKLNLPSFSDLVRYAVRNKIIEP